MGWTLSGDWECRTFTETGRAPVSQGDLKRAASSERRESVHLDSLYFPFYTPIYKTKEISQIIPAPLGNMLACIVGSEVPQGCSPREASRRAVFELMSFPGRAQLQAKSYG